MPHNIYRLEKEITLDSIILRAKDWEELMVEKKGRHAIARRDSIQFDSI
jgi:hypothetical protein